MLKTRVLFVSLTFLLCLVSTSRARTHAGTVVLDSGERIENAEYSVKTAFKIVEVVKINDVEVKRKFSFNRIAALIDVNGKDVTEKYLGRFAVRLDRPNPISEKPIEPAKQTAVKTIPEQAPDSLKSQPQNKDATTTEPVQAGLHESEQTEELTTNTTSNSSTGETWLTKRERKRDAPLTHRRLWDIGFRLGSNFSSPTGAFYEGITSGVGFGGDVIIPITHELALRGTASRSGMKWDDNFGFFSFDPNLTIISQDNSFTATRISATAEYYFYSHNGVFPPKIVGFFYSGLGAIVHNASSSISVLDNTTNIVTSSSFTDSFTKLIAVTGVGGDFMFSPSFGLEVAGNLDIVVLGSQGSSTPQYAYVIDLRFGVVTFF